MVKNIKRLLETYESDEDEDIDELEEKPEKSTNPPLTIKEVQEGKQVKLDLKDKKILYQLELNARQPNSEIAKKVGLSKEVVNYRIKRLEEQRVIKTYYPIIDLSRLGYINFRVYLKLIDATPKKEREIIDFLVKCKETFYVADIDGPLDIAFGVSVKEIHEFEIFYNRFKEHFKHLFGKEQISIFTAVYHFNRAYLLEEKIKKTLAGIIGKSKADNYDEIDWKILNLLSKNARLPIIDISEKLLIPERTVAFRIKKLEQNKIILGYKPLFNLEKLGFEYYKLDITLKNISKIKNIMSFAEASSYITYIDQTIGGSDFEMDVEVKSKTHLFELINKLKSDFLEIREINYFTLISYDKLIYLPQV